MKPTLPSQADRDRLLQGVDQAAVPLDVMQKLCPPCAHRMEEMEVTHYDLAAALEKSGDAWFKRCGTARSKARRAVRVPDCPGKRMAHFDCKVHMQPDSGEVVATISTSIVDHDGEVLLPMGLDLSIFKTNPVMLLYHHDDELPVGVWDPTSLQRSTHGIVSSGRFIERSPYHPPAAEWLPDTVKWYYQQDVLKAFSVGFLPVERRSATTKDVDRFGKSCRWVTSNWKLIEISCCNIPTNSEALAVAVGKGMTRGSILPEMWHLDDEKALRPAWGRKCLTLDIPSAAR